ncbi:MAG: MBG domain-containing protein, partial [Paludibacter sp.]
MKTKLLLIAFTLIAFVSTTWAQVPGAPTVTANSAITCNASGQLSVKFTAGTGTGITTYKYSTDGTTWMTRTDGGTTSSPIVITTLSSNGTTALTNGTNYTVKILAVNGSGDGTASTGVIGSPYAGTGTALDPYLIGNTYQLLETKTAVNAAGGTGVGAAYYQLTADVDMSPSQVGNWAGIGLTSPNVFKGNFNGNGHKVSGIHAGSTSTPTRYGGAFVGFFQFIDGATISNLAVEVDFYISNVANGTGSSPCVGGLVCQTSGTGNVLINNCTVTTPTAGSLDALALNTSSATASPTATVGGIIGAVGTTGTVTIINSSVNATLVAKNDAPLTSGTSYATCAGIVGELSGKSGRTIEVINCIAAGSLSGISTNNNSYVGGIVSTSDGTLTVWNITNCLATNSLSGTSSNNITIAGIAPKITLAGNKIQYCIALNGTINQIKSTATNPSSTPQRICSSITLGTINNNYAQVDLLVQRNVNNAGFTNITSTSTDAAGVNGSDLAASDPTGQALTKLNAYKSSNPNFTSVATGTPTYALISWPTTLSLGTTSVPYNGSAQTATVNSSVAGTVSNIKYNSSSTAPTNLGSSIVIADFKPTDVANYNSLALVAGTYTITKATPTLSLSATSISYNGSAQAATVIASVAGATPSNILYNGSATVPTNAGSYSITANFTPTDGTNYNSLTGASAGTFTIAAKALTITATGPSKTYGTVLSAGTSATNFTHSGEISGEAVNSVTLTPDGAGISATTAAGAAYVITPTLATGTGGFLAGNYNITYTAYNGTVAQKALTITATGPSKTYGTALSAGTSATNFTHSGEISGETVNSVTLTPDA